MARADVTIRGAGIWGLAIAWECTRRGARVRVVDPAGIGAGASGGLVGALSPYAPEGWNAVKAFQLASLRAAPAFWAGVEAASGLPTGYGRTGRLMPLTPAELPRAMARQAAATRYWAPDRWDVTEAPPTLNPGPCAHDTLAARLNPRATLTALAAALRGAGVGILAEDDDQAPLTIHTTGPAHPGEVTAEDHARVPRTTHAPGSSCPAGVSTAVRTPVTIHATGVAGLAETRLGRGVKGQALLLAHAAPDHPQVYADGLYIVPHADGTTAIGSTSETRWDHPTATDAQLDAQLARAVAIMPALSGAPVLARWAALRPRADTRQPVLGAWSENPGHILANGAFKIGFGLAPGVAAAIADLALTGHADLPSAFAPLSGPKYSGG